MLQGLAHGGVHAPDLGVELLDQRGGAGGIARADQAFDVGAQRGQPERPDAGRRRLERVRDAAHLLPRAVGARGAQLFDQPGQRGLVRREDALDELRLAIRIQRPQLGHAGGIQHRPGRALASGVVQIAHRPEFL